MHLLHMHVQKRAGCNLDHRKMGRAHFCSENQAGCCALLKMPRRNTDLLLPSKEVRITLMVIFSEYSFGVFVKYVSHFICNIYHNIWKVHQGLNFRVGWRDSCPKFRNPARKNSEVRISRLEKFSIFQKFLLLWNPFLKNFNVT